METKRTVLWGMAISLLFLIVLSGTASAAEFNVTTAADLQTALTTAASNMEEDTINIAAGTYNTSDNGGAPFSYVPDVTYPQYCEKYSLTIVGAGAGTTIIDGGWSGGANTDGTPGMIIDNRVFRGQSGVDSIDDSAADITISGITIQNANGDDYAGNVGYDCPESGYSQRHGGLAIETNQGAVSISNCIFKKNKGEDEGGGLSVFTFGGDITLTDSNVSNNTCYRDSGGGASLITGRGCPVYHDDEGDDTDSQNDSGRVIVTGCTFKSNGDVDGDGVADSTDYPSGDGAGLSVRASGGSIFITGCAFQDNITYTSGWVAGGGVCASTFAGDVTFTGNTVTGNYARSDGAGAQIQSELGKVTISDNLIKDNTLGYGDGAGMHVAALDGCEILNNRVIDNSAEGSYANGAGTHVKTYGCSYNNDDSEGNDDNIPSNDDNYAATAGVEMKWNTFKGNTSENSTTTYADGGGVHARVSSGFTLDVDYNSFISNTARGCGGGGLFNNGHGVIALRSNYFYDNTANTDDCEYEVGGGGAFVDTSFGTAFVINNTFVGNTTEEYGGGGLGVNLQDDLSAAKIYNNIFYNNDAGTGNGDDIHINDLYTDWPNGDFVTDDTGAFVFLDTNRYVDAYILSRDGADSANDTPNITESGTVTDDPLFLTAGSPQLDPSSPMIDAGNESALNPYQLPLFDIFGVERAYAAPLDIGAHEEAGLAVSSANATVTLRPSPAMPSDIDDVLNVAGFTATGVTDSADISITFPSLPDDFTIYKMFASGQSVEIYPTNNAAEKGITNVSLSGNVLSLTIEDNSDADLDDTVGSIDDPIVLAEEETASSVYVKDDDDDDICFIDTMMGGF